MRKIFKQSPIALPPQCCLQMAKLILLMLRLNNTRNEIYTLLLSSQSILKVVRQKLAESSPSPVPNSFVFVMCAFVSLAAHYNAKYVHTVSSKPLCNRWFIKCTTVYCLNTFALIWNSNQIHYPRSHSFSRDAKRHQGVPFVIFLTAHPPFFLRFPSNSVKSPSSAACLIPQFADTVFLIQPQRLFESCDAEEK